MALVGNQIVWDVKEPTHYMYLKRVGDISPVLWTDINLVGASFTS